MSSAHVNQPQFLYQRSADGPGMSCGVHQRRMPQRLCPQCCACEVELVHDGRYVLPDGHPLDAAVRVVVCMDCGFCFNDTPSTQADYDRYYRDASKYADPRLSSGAGSSPEDQARLAETAEAINLIAETHKDRILDIGCGTGGLLDSLANLGFHDLTGMDPASACVSEVCRRGHFGVLGTLDKNPLAEGSFDGIILSHVLEHVLELPTALRKVARLLRPTGWLYVEVPDASRYGECLIAPFQDFNLEHINHFSANTLHNLLVRNSWAVANGGAKTLPLPQGRSYPAVYAFARAGAPTTSQHDTMLRNSLADYVGNSAEQLSRIDTLLRRQVGTRQILVWGVGQLTMRLLGETFLGQASITAFVDSNPIHHGRTLAGKPVIRPESLSTDVMNDAPIVIGSLVNVESIEESIRGQRLRHQIIRLDSIGSH